jgi:integrase
MKKRKSKLIRKSWPRIRMLTNGTYQVDGRRKGTNAKQERYDTKAEAEKRARELEEDFAREGTDGAGLSSELRVAAITAANILAPYNKDIVEAARHYAAHLDSLLKLENSKFIKDLAEDWLANKRSGAQRVLRQATLDSIENGKEFLVEKFGEKRILAVTKDEIRRELDKHGSKIRRKFNLCSLMSQFFNWCIKHGHCVTNPCPLDEYTPEVKDTVGIATARQARLCMRICERKYPHLVLYHAMGFFAGLRPFEAAKLRRQDISLEHNEITVRGETSKSKETRKVRIEPNLRVWIERYLDKDEIEVVRSKNFTNQIKKLRAQLGYKVMGKNEKAAKYPHDLMRHSYGSYHRKKYNNRALLAELMGNSVEIIRKHYLNPHITGDELDAYWAIKPKFDQVATRKELDEMEAAARPLNKRPNRTR